MELPVGESNDSRHDTSSQAAKDFKEASDYFTSRKTTTSGNITDNNASSRVDQFAASLSSAKNSYDQYTSSRTRSHEYSEMASRTESMTGQMNEKPDSAVCELCSASCSTGCRSHSDQYQFS
uniref:IncF plasmid conjugative transfer protein TraG n=1 Tax=Klebsiella pneumoniae TaxID=573 RepID=A0A8B0SQI4_KLEPN|nr:IncF plasmid conjugative transfer protein TraG [Klebsiella pneumoniae]